MIFSSNKKDLPHRQLSNYLFHRLTNGNWKDDPKFFAILPPIYYQADKETSTEWLGLSGKF